jgi:hypothetical protein
VDFLFFFLKKKTKKTKKKPKKKKLSFFLFFKKKFKKKFSKKKKVEEWRLHISECPEGRKKQGWGLPFPLARQQTGEKGPRGARPSAFRHGMSPIP